MATEDQGMPVKTLATGAKFPAIGLGTWLSEPGKVRDAVYHALKTGYRHTVLAACRREVGEGIRKWLDEGNERKDVFVTSKLKITMMEPGDVEAGCDQTLKDLGLEYLDLYLMHWPYRVKKDSSIPPKNDDVLGYTPDKVAETWREMEKLVAAGKVKAIGVSNFTISKLEQLFKSAKIRPAVNQVECHPGLPQDALLAFCEKEGMVMTAYSPLGNPGRPARLVTETDPEPLRSETVKAIATARNATPAQVLLAWAIQRGTVAIPKSVTPSRIEENFGAIQLKLSEEDMKSIAALDQGVEGRIVKGHFFCKEGQDWPDLWV